MAKAKKGTKAKTVFELNPNLKAYHQTSDGAKFFSAGDAATHARTEKLDNKKVKEVLRPSGSKSKASKNDNVDTSKNDLTPMQKAQLRIEAINKLDTVEAVEKALEGEKAKTVLAAGAERIEAINKAK